MTRAIIFVNGLISDYTWLAQLPRADDLLIGADGGARHITKIGRRPHVVVGDMDSLQAAEVEQFAAQGVRLERHKPEKDQTDLELAIEPRPGSRGSSPREIGRASCRERV